ncbi:nicotinate-nucleotide adenylyltransferase [Salsuginibacillus kocurii]|uniref:nicotinate-nucleotide adenylyltransferase n=1 Tax=Salsuginibacillus kocurii TaxID=427078 RepID=UPI00035DB1B9|nr:nicotinate-nucleotide adenylyltransferase [Salsuginibacillus kocurii]
MKKIGLLGGTFDPPHSAHLVIAEAALEQCELDEIWFIPTHTPPHKEREGMTPSTKRLNMIRLATEDHPQFHVSTIEVERQGPSYTIDTVQTFKRESPDAEFYFIIGGDMADDLGTWKDISALRQLVTFVVTERPSYPSNPPFEDGIIRVKVPGLEISSSELRRRVKQQISIRYLTPDSVRTYIEENQLYE